MKIKKRRERKNRPCQNIMLEMEERESQERKKRKAYKYMTKKFAISCIGDFRDSVVLA